MLLIFLKRILIFTIILSSSSFVVSEEAWIVEDIRISGLQRISAGSIFSNIPVTIGDKVALEDIQIIKELTLSESLEKSSSISSLLNNKIISLGEDPKEKIYTLNCQSLEQIIDDLKDFKESVNALEEELEKSFLFKGENLEFTLSKETINNILKLFGNLKTEEFPENLSINLSEESINKAFLLLNKYLNIKNDQKIFFENLEDVNLSGIIYCP